MKKSSKGIESLCAELIKIPSKTKDQKQVVLALDLVNKYFEGLDLKVVNFESEGIHSRLWMNGSNLGKVTNLLCGHIDVVDAKESEFLPKVNDGKIFGRGAGDMKGHVAAMMIAFRKYLEKDMDGSVGLFLTGDEEVGGFNGARYALEKGLRAKNVIIPDGSFDFDIVESQKAPHHFHVIAKGVGGHASLAFEIDNPVNRIISLYTEMRKKYSVATTKNDWHSTFEMTKIKTGFNSENSIPSSVDAWFSWRWPLEKFTFKEGVSDFEKLCKKYDCVEIKNDLLVDNEVLRASHGKGEGCVTDKDDPLIVLWKQTAETVLKRKVGYTVMHGSTDGRHFYKFGSKVITTSAISGKHHSDGEWVDLKSLEQLSRIIEIFLLKSSSLT